MNVSAVSLVFLSISLFFCTGCFSLPMPGDPDMPVKTEFTQAEIDQMKSEGMLGSDIENMNDTIIEYGNANREFTLVELLYVIAITGISVGLLLPALQAVRRTHLRRS